jgi:tRNA pseudouridine55 synthase
VTGDPQADARRPAAGAARPAGAADDATPPPRSLEPDAPPEPLAPPEGGVVLVDKEAGPSSFAVVRRVRTRFGRKAGHAGTLDPFATGLLVCLVGRSTRLAQYLVGLDKRYETTIRLGVRTTTGDTEGDELERAEPAGRDRIESLRGEVELPVPAASAVKVGGERAYRLHRRGVAVEMPTRRSTIHDLEIRRLDGDEVELSLRVSSGTYVRAIADALGGHCTALRRTAVGPFLVQDADERTLLPPLAAVEHLPRRDLDPAEAEAVRTGRRLPAEGDGPLALVAEGRLVAVAQVSGGEARPETVLG